MEWHGGVESYNCTHSRLCNSSCAIITTYISEIGRALASSGVFSLACVSLRLTFSSNLADFVRLYFYIQVQCGIRTACFKYFVFWVYHSWTVVYEHWVTNTQNMLFLSLAVICSYFVHCEAQYIAAEMELKKQLSIIFLVKKTQIKSTVIYIRNTQTGTSKIKTKSFRLGSRESIS